MLIPLLLTAAILTSRRRGRRWQRLVASRLRPLLVRPRSRARRWISYAVSLLAFSLVIVSLAGPNAGYRDETETIRGRNLLLAIDVSRSMLATDESPNRLAAVRAAALEILDRFPNDRIGIIAFSGSPWLQAPLTIDHAALPETLQQLDADTLPRGGSDLQAAIELAVRTLKETGQRTNALIVLSDGEFHEGDIENAADDADEAGVTIFAAGFGSEEGAFIPDPKQRDGRLRDRNGSLVFSRLKSEPLRLLARRTGGFYTLGSGKYFATNLGSAVEQLDRFEMEGNQRRVPIPRFHWFLVPAIVLFIIGRLLNTPWHILRAPAAAALAILCFPSGAEARLLPATPGERALADGRNEDALELFATEIAEARGERKARLHLGEGAAAYRLKDFTRALAAYSEALLAEDPAVQEQAHYALGNSLFFRGLAYLQPDDPEETKPDPEQAIAHWRDALGHFDDALAINPANQNAAENRDRVRKMLEDLQQQQEQQEQQQDREQQNSENQDGEGHPNQDPQ
ncbi:MAG: VWA domain-containing protein, partial [Akkermansiaceae bacterium]|nr:VWA domain-containing protein [Akkermansiaceae bacterium]